MEYTSFFDKIRLPEGGQEVFAKLHAHTGEPEFQQMVEAAFRAYDEGDQTFGEFVVANAEAWGVTAEELILYLYLLKGRDSLVAGLERGLPEDVLVSALSTLTSSCNLCYQQMQVYGIPQKTYRNWARHCLDGTIFPLGRLQFELLPSPYTVELEGHRLEEGQTCISVHIPAAGSLDEETCEAAYAQARVFFDKYFGMNPCFFMCNSWMMHPWLSEDLPATSRVVQFQSKYTLVEARDNEQAIRSWVFGRTTVPLEELPEDNSLRRAAKARLLKGMPIGTAKSYRL